MDFKEIKGVIFDLDGTILDSMSAWDGIGLRFLQQNNIDPPEDLEQRLKVMSYVDSAQYFIEELGLNLTVEEIGTGINAMLEKQYLETIPLKEGVEEVLQKLRDQNIKMCVATATNGELSKKALKRLGILHFFEDIISCEDLKSSKTEPVIYYKAIEVLGLQPEDVVIVEDALHCIETCKKAGFKVIGVYDQSAHKNNSQIREKCDLYLEGVKDMGDLI